MYATERSPSPYQDASSQEQRSRGVGPILQGRRIVRGDRPIDLVPSELIPLRDMLPAQEVEIPARAGPSEEFFARLISFWRLSEEDASRLLSGGRRVLSGARLNPRNLDRVVELAAIRSLLSALFDSADAENDFLREKRDDLGKRSPMDLLLDGGWRSLLLAKEFIQFIAGK